jgi:hypothetical protein
MVWLKANESKRAHVRHIQLESLWELDVGFFRTGNSNQQKKASFSLKPVWGRAGMSTVMFPNLRSITQKIRVKFNKDWKWPSPNVLNIKINIDGTHVIWSKGQDLLIHKAARERAEKLVVTAIQARWNHLKAERYLANMDIGFMYSTTLEWDGEVAMKPFLSVV